MLEGYDTAWVDAGTRRSAYYTSLPPGSYVFRVKASNNDGVWNKSGAELRFTRQQGHEAAAEQGVVVDHEDADAVRHVRRVRCVARRRWFVPAAGPAG